MLVEKDIEASLECPDLNSMASEYEVRLEKVDLQQQQSSVGDPIATSITKDVRSATVQQPSCADTVPSSPLSEPATSEAWKSQKWKPLGPVVGPAGRSEGVEEDGRSPLPTTPSISSTRKASKKRKINGKDDSPWEINALVGTAPGGTPAVAPAIIPAASECEMMSLFQQGSPYPPSSVLENTLRSSKSLPSPPNFTLGDGYGSQSSSTLSESPTASQNVAFADHKASQLSHVTDTQPISMATDVTMATTGPVEVDGGRVPKGLGTPAIPMYATETKGVEMEDIAGSSSSSSLESFDQQYPVQEFDHPKSPPLARPDQVSILEQYSLAKAGFPGVQLGRMGSEGLSLDQMRVSDLLAVRGMPSPQQLLDSAAFPMGKHYLNNSGPISQHRSEPGCDSAMSLHTSMGGSPVLHGHNDICSDRSPSNPTRQEEDEAARPVCQPMENKLDMPVGFGGWPGQFPMDTGLQRYPYLLMPPPWMQAPRGSAVFSGYQGSVLPNMDIAAAAAAASYRGQYYLPFPPLHAPTKQPCVSSAAVSQPLTPTSVPLFPYSRSSPVSNLWSLSDSTGSSRSPASPCSNVGDVSEKSAPSPMSWVGQPAMLGSSYPSLPFYKAPFVPMVSNGGGGTLQQQLPGSYASRLLMFGGGMSGAQVSPFQVGHRTGSPLQEQHGGPFQGGHRTGSPLQEHHVSPFQGVQSALPGSQGATAENQGSPQQGATQLCHKVTDERAVVMEDTRHHKRHSVDLPRHGSMARHLENAQLTSPGRRQSLTDPKQQKQSPLHVATSVVVSTPSPSGASTSPLKVPAFPPHPPPSAATPTGVALVASPPTPVLAGGTPHTDSSDTTHSPSTNTAAHLSRLNWTAVSSSTSSSTLGTIVDHARASSVSTQLDSSTRPPLLSNPSPVQEKAKPVKKQRQRNLPRKHRGPTTTDASVSGHPLPHPSSLPAPSFHVQPEVVNAPSPPTSHESPMDTYGLAMLAACSTLQSQGKTGLPMRLSSLGQTEGLQNGHRGGGLDGTSSPQRHNEPPGGSDVSLVRGYAPLPTQSQQLGEHVAVDTLLQLSVTMQNGAAPETSAERSGEVGIVGRSRSASYSAAEAILMIAQGENNPSGDVEEESVTAGTSKGAGEVLEQHHEDTSEGAEEVFEQHHEGTTEDAEEVFEQHHEGELSSKLPRALWESGVTRIGASCLQARVDRESVDSESTLTPPGSPEWHASPFAPNSGDCIQESSHPMRPAEGAFVHPLRPAEGAFVHPMRPAEGAFMHPLRPAEGAFVHPLRPAEDTFEHPLRPAEGAFVHPSSSDLSAVSVKRIQECVTPAEPVTTTCTEAEDREGDDVQVSEHAMPSRVRRQPPATREVCRTTRDLCVASSTKEAQTSSPSNSSTVEDGSPGHYLEGHKVQFSTSSRRCPSTTSSPPPSPTQSTLSPWTARVDTPTTGSSRVGHSVSSSPEEEHGPSSTTMRGGSAVQSKCLPAQSTSHHRERGHGRAPRPPPSPPRGLTTPTSGGIPEVDSFVGESRLENRGVASADSRGEEDVWGECGSVGTQSLPNCSLPSVQQMLMTGIGSCPSSLGCLLAPQMSTRRSIRGDMATTAPEQVTSSAEATHALSSSTLPSNSSAEADALCHAPVTTTTTTTSFSAREPSGQRQQQQHDLYTTTASSSSSSTSNFPTSSVAQVSSFSSSSSSAWEDCQISSSSAEHPPEGSGRGHEQAGASRHLQSKQGAVRSNGKWSHHQSDAAGIHNSVRCSSGSERIGNADTSSPDDRSLSKPSSLPSLLTPPLSGLQSPVKRLGELQRQSSEDSQPCSGDPLHPPAMRSGCHSSSQLCGMISDAQGLSMSGDDSALSNSATPFGNGLCLTEPTQAQICTSKDFSPMPHRNPRSQSSKKPPWRQRWDQPGLEMTSSNGAVSASEQPSPSGQKNVLHHADNRNDSLSKADESVLDSTASPAESPAGKVRPPSLNHREPDMLNWAQWSRSSKEAKRHLEADGDEHYGDTMAAKKHRKLNGSDGNIARREVQVTIGSEGSSSFSGHHKK